MAKQRVYRVIFTNQGKVFEIQARRVQSEELYAQTGRGAGQIMT